MRTCDLHKQGTLVICHSLIFNCFPDVLTPDNIDKNLHEPVFYLMYALLFAFTPSKSEKDQRTIKEIKE